MEDLNLALDLVLRAEALHLIHRLEVDLDRVPGAHDGRGEALDLAECGDEAVPLRGVLLAALGDGERVGEGRGVGPEGEFLEGGGAGEELD